MVALGSGLIVTPNLSSSHVVTVDMHFEPSVGILARKLKVLGSELHDFRELMNKIVQEVMIPSIRTNFAVEGRPAWEPLAQSTLLTKSREGNGGGLILSRTGALRRAATSFGIWSIDSQKAMVTDIPVFYGAIHQAGAGGGTHTYTVKNVATGESQSYTESGEGGDGSIPARPFIVVQPEDIDRMEFMTNEWLGTKIHEAGL